MGTHYNRLPPLIVMMLAFVLGGLYLRTWGRAPTTETRSLEWLETNIGKAAHKEDKAMWLEYAHALAAAGKYERSLAAYRTALAMDPGNSNIRLAIATTMAQGKLLDQLYDYLDEQVYSRPREVVDLLKRQEFQACLAEPRFKELNQRAIVLAQD